MWVYTTMQAFGITEGDVSQGEPSVTIVLIPDVEFSLEPHTCMCQSMDNLSNKIRFPGVEVGQLPYSCVTAPDCSGVMCNFTAQQATVLSTQFAVDPCSEVLVLNSRTAGTEKANSIMFNETEDRPFTGGGISVTVHVVLKHHNFSMDIQVRLCVCVCVCMCVCMCACVCVCVWVGGYCVCLVQLFGDIY